MADASVNTAAGDDDQEAEPLRTVRVVLADDQSLMRMGFRMVLDAEEGIEVVGEASDGAAAVSQAKALRPDVILMDVRMPGMNGIEATQIIAQECPSTRILILTTFDLDEYAFSGLRAGASGFLLKDTRPTELAEAIRTVASGEAVVSRLGHHGQDPRGQCAGQAGRARPGAGRRRGLRDRPHDLTSPFFFSTICMRSSFSGPGKGRSHANCRKEGGYEKWGRAGSACQEV